MAEYMSISGLVLDIVGVVLLFRFAPEKFQDPQSAAFFKVEGEAAKRREEWVRKQPQRAIIARCAVWLLILGFSLQIYGEVLAAGWL